MPHQFSRSAVRPVRRRRKLLRRQQPGQRDIRLHRRRRHQGRANDRGPFPRPSALQPFPSPPQGEGKAKPIRAQGEPLPNPPQGEGMAIPIRAQGEPLPNPPQGEGMAKPIGAQGEPLPNPPQGEGMAIPIRAQGWQCRGGPPWPP